MEVGGKLVISDLNELVQALHRVFESDRVNVDEVKQILSAYKSNPRDWKRFAKFDPFRYTRNLVDEGNGKFNLMALCWGEQNGSSIHDHANAHCFVKILDGELMETMFDWPSGSEEGEEMKKTNVNVYHKDEVTYINDSIGLHRMENPSHTEKTVSLHLYCPPFNACRIFDERTGRENTVQVTFWSKYGKRTPFVTESAIAPVREVTPCCYDNPPENN